MRAGEKDGYDPLLPRSSTIATVNHLFVFHHGMWGVSAHLDYIAETVVKTHKSPDVNIFPLMVKKNEIFRSYSGIRACAQRLKEEIEEEMDRLEDVMTHISFIGYSAGGLICRYCLGLLEDNGFFEKVVPVNFFLFASPNAGIHRFLTSPHSLTNLNYQVFNWFTSKLGWLIGGKTCVEMALQDDPEAPLVHLMSLTPFLNILRRFKKRVVFANIFYDRAVPFESAALYAGRSPYEQFSNGINPYTAKDQHPAQYVAAEVDLSNAEEGMPADEVAKLQHAAAEAPGWCTTMRSVALKLALPVLLPPLVLCVWLPLVLGVGIPVMYVLGRWHYAPNNSIPCCGAEKAARTKISSSASSSDRGMRTREMIKRLQTAFQWSYHCWVPGFTTHGVLVARNYSRPWAWNARDAVPTIEFAVRAMQNGME